MIPILDFLRDETVVFQGTYHGISIKRFAWFVPGSSDQEVLTGLMNHAQYHDDYISPWRGRIGVHGPYRIGGLSAASYFPISHDDARYFVDRYAHGMDADAAALEQTRLAVVDRLSTATVIWRLEDLGVEVMHDYGYILDDFAELVAIDRHDQRVTLIVLAGD